MNDYLKSFVIGSSWMVFIIFYLAVASSKRKNYSYRNYTMIAPVYLGLMNVFSLILAKKWNLSLRTRYIVIGIISPLIVISIAMGLQAYNYTFEEWVRYSVMLIVKHFLIFNVVVYNLELYTENYTNSSEKIDKMVKLIVNRGILSPNCDWWKISERELEDASGVNLYYELKEKYGKIIPVTMVGQKINVVTDVDYIRIILDNSPFIFGVGKLKKKMFRTFMSKNVGVSEGCPWIKRRTLNVKVLDTDRLHIYSNTYNDYIQNLLTTNNLPKNFEEFSQFGKKVTMKVVFGTEDTPDEVFDVFSLANSLSTFHDPDFSIDESVMDVYKKYIEKQIKNPKENSLVFLATENTNDVEELIHQIPHWIFPIGGLIHTTVPRILLFLHNHPEKLKKLQNTLDSGKNSNKIYDNVYLRNCILETLRLNNPVVTTFRTLLSDFDFGDGEKFKEGEQFLILNNPVLRNPKVFSEPNKFIPERWTPDLELSYSAIMFNQGPQRCPGKELAIFILQSFVTHYLLRSNGLEMREIDTSDIPQMINPCTITV